jgi:hypothetical protein
VKYLIDCEVNAERGERVVAVEDATITLAPEWMQGRHPCYEYTPEGGKRYRQGWHYLDDRHVWPSRAAAEAELARRQRPVRDA